jgi:hypothetical protein
VPERLGPAKNRIFGKSFDFTSKKYSFMYVVYIFTGYDRKVIPLTGGIYRVYSLVELVRYL